MPETIKVAEYIAPQQTKSGKWTPHKFRDGNGRTFTFGKQDAELIKGHVGQSLDIEYGQKNSFEEYPLTSARVAEPPKPQQTGNGWKRDPEEGRLIVRQTALKAAVELLSRCPPETVADLLNVADQFVAWVYGERVEPVSSAAAPAPAQPPSPRRYTTGLREGEDLATAAKRALDRDLLAEADIDLSHIPPADAEDGPSLRQPVPAAREVLRGSGPARR